ncbi:MAG: PBP1A family penicillin-binding protein [Acidobacteriaceae bacterium]|nr:PBP1A family penicillin-binding protein [Acidobacteriaceae bacterium]MBV9306932.1 PBP1A family penicillin-binding protein [Acidobacteriaceae bacterium]
MYSFWKQCEEQVIAESYTLKKLWSENEEQAIFGAEYHRQNAVWPVVIKLAYDLALDSSSSAADLTHPHLSSPLTSGRWIINGVPLLCSVFDPADTNLAVSLQQRPLTDREALHFLVEIADALAYLHERNIVHGRVTTANILLVGKEYKLCSDLACYAADPRSLTNTTIYDPSEAASAICSTVQDIWNLAVCLVEALTQNRPVLADSGNEIILPPHLPPRFESVVLGVLQVQAARRWTLAQIREWASRELRRIEAPPARSLFPMKISSAVTRQYLHSLTASFPWFRSGWLRLCHADFGKVPLLVWCSLVVFIGISYSAWHRLENYWLDVDRRIQQDPFSGSSNLYAAPWRLTPGDIINAEDVILHLKRSGYSPQPGAAVGSYQISSNSIEIRPGADAVLEQEPVRLEFHGGTLSRIVSLRGHRARSEYFVEPELITNLLSGSREKRQLLRFSDIPPVLVHAVLSVEDKRFFQHPGFDPLRLLRAAYEDTREGRKGQGASTLTMQLARNLWLEPEKTWKRKAQELLISLRLEQKLTKQQIFEYYCNQVYLGHHDTYDLHGFGEAARTYFGKPVAQLTLPEAALLAGLVQRPSYYNPFRYPDRARKRRNTVLRLMQENGFITVAEFATASVAPVTVTPPEEQTEDLPYFLSLVTDELKRLALDQHAATGASRVYTTLDTTLQHAAEEAVRAGMANVDRQLRKRRQSGEGLGAAQAALIALDPHTGEVKALVGGRNYAASQLNHALALRQPGSVFKPFVYAAALQSGLDENDEPMNPDTTVVDLPTTFWFQGRPYQPGNFHDHYEGIVTLREAMAHSLNIPAVRVAEMVGYDRVVALAKEAGLNHAIQPTPAVALGAYETTPLEIAGAYTVFANEGQYVRPTFLLHIEDSRGRVVYEHQPKAKRVLEPQTSDSMLDLLQEVVRQGTATAVQRALKAQVAAKTGTSRDGWFAGFTPQLLCVVWVGFDDNRELGLEGARSALPIWVEFMKRALRQPQYGGSFPPSEHEYQQDFGEMRKTSY